MAEEAFAKEVGSIYTNVQFYIQEKVDIFLTALKHGVDDNTIVIVKNIELFDTNVFEAVNSMKNLIISGDVNKSKVNDLVLKKHFTTKVYFTPLKGKDLSHLKKFQGSVFSDDYEGITTLSEL